MARRGSIAGAVTAAAVALAALFGVHQALGPGGGLYETKRTLWPAYQAAPRSWDRWGPTTGLDSRINAMRDRLRKHDGESFQIKTGNDDWSRLRNLFNTMKVIRFRMTHAKILAVWYVRAKKDGYQEGIRKLDLNPAKATATEGTDAIDIVVGTLRYLYPQINIGGIYECRTTISGGISQHAHANAVDVTASYSYMNMVAHAMLALTIRGYIPVSQILWDYHNLLSGNYVYDHTNHIHFSGDPLINSYGCSHPSSSKPSTSGVNESEDQYGQPGESEQEYASPPPGLGATGPTGSTTPTGGPTP